MVQRRKVAPAGLGSPDCSSRCPRSWGIASQVFLVWVIIGFFMPFFGLELLNMARCAADFNLPARVGQLFGVSL